MSAKNLKILVIIFLLLAGLLAGKLLLPKFQTQKSAYLLGTAGIAKDTVQRIEISQSTQKVELAREGDSWKTGGKKADKSKVDMVLSFFLPTEAPDEIAQTDKRHDELGLTEEKATKVKFDDKITFFSGKNSGSEMYVRLGDSPTVYLLTYPPSLSLKESDWYDTAVTDIDQSKITEVSFQDNTTDVYFALVKKDDKWQTKQFGKEAKKDKVESVLSALSTLKAQSLYDESTKTWYPKTPGFVVVYTADGKNETLEFYKGESDYLVKRISDGMRFIMSESTLTPILNAPKEVI